METKKNSNVFIMAIKIGLVLYTMIRTVDLVMSTLPAGVKIFGALAVFGLDIALLAWDNYAADPYKARSDGQHKVALGMIIVNLIGIGAAMVGDSMRIVDPGAYNDVISTISIWVISGVILSNVAALIAVNQMDPDRAEAQAAAEHERKLKMMEKSHDRKLQEANRQTELDIAELRNKTQIKKARQAFYLPDDDGNGVPDLVDAANRGDMPALRKQLEAALSALNKTEAKSPNGRMLAADGSAAPKVTDRKE